MKRGSVCGAHRALYPKAQRCQYKSVRRITSRGVSRLFSRMKLSTENLQIVFILKKKDVVGVRLCCDIILPLRASPSSQLSLFPSFPPNRRYLRLPTVAVDQASSFSAGAGVRTIPNIWSPLVVTSSNAYYNPNHNPIISKFCQWCAARCACAPLSLLGRTKTFSLPVDTVLTSGIIPYSACLFAEIRRFIVVPP